MNHFKYFIHALWATLYHYSSQRLHFLDYSKVFFFFLYFVYQNWNIMKDMSFPSYLIQLIDYTIVL